jgi:hypothetical protein
MENVTVALSYRSFETLAKVFTNERLCKSAHNCCCCWAASGDADEEEEEEEKPLLLLPLLPAGHRCGYAAIPPDDAPNRRDRTSLLEGAIATQRAAGMGYTAQRGWVLGHRACTPWLGTCIVRPPAQPDDVCSQLDYPTDRVNAVATIFWRKHFQRFAKPISRRSVGGHIPHSRPALTLKGSRVYKRGTKAHLAKFFSSFGAAAAPARTHRCAASSERSLYTAHRSCGRPANPRPRVAITTSHSVRRRLTVA